MSGLRRLAGPVVAALFLLGGCHEVLNDLPSLQVQSVVVTPDSSDLAIGAQTEVHAFPLDKSGAFRPGKTVLWVSSDPSVAAVDDTGGVAGLAAGTVTITATVDGVPGTARLRVGNAPSIGVSSATPTFDAQAGQSSPAPQTIAVSNAGGLTLSGLSLGTILYAGGQQNWLIAGLDATSAPATLTLTAISAGIFTAGSYTATVPILSTVAANSPLNVTVTLNVAPGPPAARVIVVVAGNNQSAAAGTQVTIAPSVQVTDTFGNPVSGLQITFSVLSGGGSVVGGSAITSGTGVATVGSWTVQATGGVPASGFYPNQLLVSGQAAASVTFDAGAFFSYTAHVHGIWAGQGCTFCHTATGGLGGLSLGGTAATTYNSALFNIATTCQSGQLVEVASGGGVTAEAASLLMQKVDHTAPAACPGGMPSNATTIPAAVRDTIRAWIRAGAPFN